MNTLDKCAKCLIHTDINEMEPVLRLSGMLKAESHEGNNPGTSCLEIVVYHLEDEDVVLITASAERLINKQNRKMAFHALSIYSFPKQASLCFIKFMKIV